MLATTPRSLHLYADLGSAEPPLVQTIQAFGEALQGFGYHRQFDTDLDGDDDLVVTTATFGNEPPKIHILENRGADLFGQPESVTLPEFTDGLETLTLAELDGDGMLDLFVDRPGDEWGLYFAETGGWSDPVIVSTPALTYGAREHGVVDIDLDGRDDLLAGGVGHAVLALSVGRAQPTQINFDYSALASPDKNWSSHVRAANLDGDAEPEVLVLLYPSDNEYAMLEHVTLFILDGITADGLAAVHEIQLPVCPGQESYRMAPLEFDGDGRTDLIIDARGDCRDDGATLLLRRD
jgi:hypothetical protein